MSISSISNDGIPVDFSNLDSPQGRAKDKTSWSSVSLNDLYDTPAADPYSYSKTTSLNSISNDGIPVDLSKLDSPQGGTKDKTPWSSVSLYDTPDRYSYSKTASLNSNTAASKPMNNAANSSTSGASVSDIFGGPAVAATTKGNGADTVTDGRKATGIVSNGTWTPTDPKVKVHYPKDYEQAYPDDPNATDPANPALQAMMGFGHGGTDAWGGLAKFLSPSIGESILKTNREFNAEQYVKKGYEPGGTPASIARGAGKVFGTATGLLPLIVGGEKAFAAKFGAPALNTLRTGAAYLGGALSGAQTGLGIVNRNLEQTTEGLVAGGTICRGIAVC